MNTKVRFKNTQTPPVCLEKRTFYDMALTFYMLIMLIMQISSFVCLSPTRTCRAMVRRVQQRH